jgi:hypothetical protein
MRPHQRRATPSRVETIPMREDHSERNQFSDIELEVSDLELEDVVGGSAKTFQANTNRYDPYKSFRFR